MGDISNKLEDIKLIITDIDGVWTDGGLYYTADGMVMKKFYVRDGMGVVLFRNAGLEVAIISGDDSEIIKTRARKLRIELCYTGIEHKTISLNEIMQKRNLKKENIAYIGDDVNDLEILPFVGLSACPCDACDEMLESVDYICKKPGGKGAFREIVDMVLKYKTV